MTKEQIIDPGTGMDHARPDDPIHGMAADMIAASIEKKLSEAGGTSAPKGAPSPAGPTGPVGDPSPEGHVVAPPAAPQPGEGPVTDFTKVFRRPDPVPAPAVAPTVQLPPDTPIQDPDDLQSDKAKNAWQELKSRFKQSRQFAVEMQNKVAELEKQAQTSAGERLQFTDELKNRDVRIKELEDQLGKLSLEHQPQFREKYDKPMGDIVSQIEGIISDSTNLADPEQVHATADKLLDVNDSDFNRMVSKLPAPVQGLLLEKRREFSRLGEARSHAISEWQTTQAGVVASANQQGIVERAQRRRDMAESAIKFTQVDTPPEERFSIFTEPTYADDVKNADAGFRGFMQEATDEQIANAAYKGFLTPVLQRQISYLVEACEQWRTAYESVRGLRHPPVRAMHVRTPDPTPPPQPVAPLDPGDSFHDSVRKSVEGAFASAGVR